MTLPKPKNEIYVTGVVIPNGVADHENDILTKTDIKKIFTKYINQDTDTMHTRIRNHGVNVLANWISEVDRTIDGKVAPAGSWLVTLQITNEDIIQKINDGTIKGLSLGSVSDKAFNTDYWFINKSINYKDLDDAEEIVPLFISLVDLPSNMYGLEVSDYNVYIEKRMKKVDTMSNEEKIEIGDEKISIGALGKIKDLFSINKSVEAKEPEQEVKVETKTEDNVDAKIDELSNKVDNIPEAVAEGIVKGFEKVGLMKEEPEETEPDETEVETEPEETEATETKPVKTDEVEINKRQTTKDNDTGNPNTSTNFYEMSGRDPFGCRK